MQRPVQPWLEAIFRSPELYEGRIIAISNDTNIIAVADSYRAAREASLQRQAPSGDNSIIISFFSVPYNVRNVQIMTLRLRSLREDMWSPMYDVTLQSSHGELANCRMLIDSGADISLISKQAGVELGLQRSEEEEALTAQGIGGSIAYLMRKIVIVIDNYAVAASVAWCQDDTVTDLIIGRKDIFDAFNVEFRQRERMIVFSPTALLRQINTDRIL